jgi:uncharacterized protein YfkK (UPF0435 family)
MAENETEKRAFSFFEDSHNREHRTITETMKELNSKLNKLGLINQSILETQKHQGEQIEDLVEKSNNQLKILEDLKSEISKMKYVEINDDEDLPVKRDLNSWAQSV